MSANTVILAEDERHIAMLVTFALEAAGYSVEHYDNGSAALERLCSGPVPLAVILDMMMPGASGLEVLQAAKARPELAETPIIICSARARDSDRDAAMAAGAHTYLTKPFSTEELTTLIRTAAG